MIERISAPDHVLALRLAGKVTAADVADVRSTLDPMLERHEGIGFVLDLTGFEDATAEAIADDLRYELGLLDRAGQFRRAALVTDKEWLGVLAEFMAKLLPRLEMRTFGPAQRDDAVRWASDLPGAVDDDAPSIRVVATDRDDVLWFEVDGVITAAGLGVVIDQVNALLARHDKVRMLARIKHFDGVEPAAFLQSGLVSMKLAAIHKMERYAIVGAPAWMDRIVEILNPVFPDIDMRTFPADREAEAWSWLGAKPLAA